MVCHSLRQLDAEKGLKHKEHNQREEDHHVRNIAIQNQSLKLLSRKTVAQHSNIKHINRRKNPKIDWQVL
ncbi:MAG TPA: hypothetical protein DEP12_00455 [Planctomycetaceae bacterium]|nr:hypothetical protein [Planctomycetaceae bacterium]